MWMFSSATGCLRSRRDRPYVDSGEIEAVAVNLEGTKYTLAVPAYTYEAGLKDYADIAKFRDSLDEKIYGIEPGNVGNELMQNAIDDGTYGLDDWQVAASSVTGMMSQVASDIRNGQWIAFLGWEPHWMNVDFDIRYLKDPENLWVMPARCPRWSPATSPSVIPTSSPFSTTWSCPSPSRTSGSTPTAARTSRWKRRRDLDPVASRTGNAWLEGVTTADGETRAQDAYQASR